MIPVVSAALYVRVSTEEQAMEGYSIDAQKELLTNYCIAQDYEIFRIYADEGFSGRSDRRPAYREMMEEMAEWDVMVVLKMDRIHRNSRNFMNMMDELGRQGKQFISATENLDTTNAMGKFVMSMIQNIAQLESEQIGERTYTGMREKAETMNNVPGESRTLGFNPPYGYVLDGGLLRSVPEELKTVREIFCGYLDGNSLADVAESLNRSGLRTRRGNKWTVYSIGTVLHNPVYAGYLRWEDLTIRHYAEVPVDPVTFNRVQRMAAEKERDPSKRSPRLLPEDDFEADGA